MLAAALFAVGLLGVITQRNAIRILISVEMLLNAANINFVAFSSYHGHADGYAFALFVIAFAAAEAAVGLAIFINLFRLRESIDVGGLAAMKG
jgi:NADH-quinone oxidoreductase subunit K